MIEYTDSIKGKINEYKKRDFIGRVARNIHYNFNIDCTDTNVSDELDYDRDYKFKEFVSKNNLENYNTVDVLDLMFERWALKAEKRFSRIKDVKRQMSNIMVYAYNIRESKERYKIVNDIFKTVKDICKTLGDDLDKLLYTVLTVEYECNMICHVVYMISAIISLEKHKVSEIYFGNNCEYICKLYTKHNVFNSWFEQSFRETLTFIVLRKNKDLYNKIYNKQHSFDELYHSAYKIKEIENTGLCDRIIKEVGDAKIYDFYEDFNAISFFSRSNRDAYREIMYSLIDCRDNQLMELIKDNSKYCYCKCNEINLYLYILMCKAMNIFTESYTHDVGILSRRYVADDIVDITYNFSDERIISGGVRYRIHEYIYNGDCNICMAVDSSAVKNIYIIREFNDFESMFDCCLEYLIMFVGLALLGIKTAGEMLLNSLKEAIDLLKPMMVSKKDIEAYENICDICNSIEYSVSKISDRFDSKKSIGNTEKGESKGNDWYTDNETIKYSPFIRRLPMGENVSQSALDLAKKLKINVPDGYTLVREHTRKIRNIKHK